MIPSRPYSWLAGIFFAFILYGSLVPFHWQTQSWGGAWESFRAALANKPVLRSRSDFLANVLLYIPLGFLLMGALGAGPNRRRGWFLALPAALACFLVSAGMEFAQTFFPPRVPSLSDLLANTAGGCLGTVCWLGFGPTLTDWCWRVWSAQTGIGLGSMLLPAYLFFLVLVHVLPLDLSLSPADLYRKYYDGMVLLIPFTLSSSDWFEQIEKYLANFFYFFPVGLLSAFHSTLVGNNRNKNWLRMTVLGVALAGGIEFLQLFVQNRFCDVTDILTGGLAILGGWGLGAILQEKSLRFLLFQRLWLFLLVWMGVVLFVNWRPFAFAFPPRLPDHWLPFVDYHDQDYFHSLDQLLRKTLLFLPGGMFLTLALPSWKGRTITGLVLVLASTAELGQLFLPGRYFSVTDILLETVGAMLGNRLTWHFRARLNKEDGHFP